MATIEISKDSALPIILIYAPPFVNWDGLGKKVASELQTLLDQARQPIYVLADLSASNPTLLQIALAADLHTKASWIAHENLAGVLIVSQDPDIRTKVVTEMSKEVSTPLRFFADRVSALRSLGVATPTQVINPSTSVRPVRTALTG